MNTKGIQGLGFALLAWVVAWATMFALEQKLALSNLAMQAPHARNVILTVRFHDVPWVPMDRRVHVPTLGRGFGRVQVHYGFMNTPDVPKALELTASHGLHVPLFETSQVAKTEAQVS